MPTKKHRINVTLDDDVYFAIRDYCEVSGSSMSGFIASSMVQAAPSLVALTEVVKSSDDVKQGLLDLAIEAGSSVSSVCSELEQMENPLSFNKGVNFLQDTENKQNTKKVASNKKHLREVK